LHGLPGRIDQLASGLDLLHARDGAPFQKPQERRPIQRRTVRQLARQTYLLQRLQGRPLR
jgi:hypothetical protein